MKSLVAMFTVLLLTLMLSGCNTTRGLGEDVEATGEAIEQSAQAAKEELTDED